MNEVSVRIVIGRANAKQTSVQMFRDGHGDDKVEAMADYFDSVLTEAMKSVMSQSEHTDSKWLIPPKPPDHETLP